MLMNKNRVSVLVTLIPEEILAKALTTLVLVSSLTAAAVNASLTFDSSSSTEKIVVSTGLKASDRW